MKKQLVFAVVGIIGIGFFALGIAHAAVIQPATPPNKDILAILVDFKDDQHDTTSDTQKTIQATLGKVNDFYKENDLTGAFTGFTYDVTPTYVDLKNENASSLNVDQVIKDTLAAESQQFPSLQQKNYKYFYIILPHRLECFSIDGACSTLSLDPTDPTEIIGNKIFINGPQQFQVFVHELGHALPVHLQHVGQLNCGSENINILSRCTGYDYDPNNIMGNGAMHFTAYQKEKLGFITSGMEKTLSPSTGGGTFSLSPIELQATNPNDVKALKIVSPSGNTYYVEYRQPIGFDAYKGGIAYAPVLYMAYTGGDLAAANHEAHAPASSRKSNTPEIVSLYNNFQAQPFTDSLDDSSQLIVSLVKQDGNSAVVKVDFIEKNPELHGPSSIILNPKIDSIPLSLSVSLKNQPGAAKYSIQYYFDGNLLQDPVSQLLGDQTSPVFSLATGVASHPDGTGGQYWTLDNRGANAGTHTLYAVISVKDTKGNVLNTIKTTTLSVAFLPETLLTISTNSTLTLDPKLSAVPLTIHIATNNYPKNSANFQSMISVGGNDSIPAEPQEPNPSYDLVGQVYKQKDGTWTLNGNTLESGKDYPILANMHILDKAGAIVDSAIYSNTVSIHVNILPAAPLGMLSSPASVVLDPLANKDSRGQYVPLTVTLSITNPPAAAVYANALVIHTDNEGVEHEDIPSGDINLQTNNITGNIYFLANGSWTLNGNVITPGSHTIFAKVRFEDKDHKDLGLSIDTNILSINFIKKEAVNTSFSLGGDIFGTPTNNCISSTAVHTLILSGQNLPADLTAQYHIGLILDGKALSDPTDPNKNPIELDVSNISMGQGIKYFKSFPINISSTPNPSSILLNGIGADASSLNASISSGKHTLYAQVSLYTVNGNSFIGTYNTNTVSMNINPAVTNPTICTPH